MTIRCLPAHSLRVAEKGRSPQNLIILEESGILRGYQAPTRYTQPRRERTWEPRSSTRLGRPGCICMCICACMCVCMQVRSQFRCRETLRTWAPRYVASMRLCR